MTTRRFPSTLALVLLLFACLLVYALAAFACFAALFLFEWWIAFGAALVALVAFGVGWQVLVWLPGEFPITFAVLHEVPETTPVGGSPGLIGADRG
jgi:hypothetical protein